jgi:hypothetical protein
MHAPSDCGSCLSECKLLLTFHDVESMRLRSHVGDWSNAYYITETNQHIQTDHFEKKKNLRHAHYLWLIFVVIYGVERNQVY